MSIPSVLGVFALYMHEKGKFKDRKRKLNIRYLETPNSMLSRLNPFNMFHNPVGEVLIFS